MGRTTGLLLGIALAACGGPAPESVDGEGGLHATVGLKNTVHTASNGDLWPSCWSSDGGLYAAWGDGFGFATDRSGRRPDIGVARLTGSPADRITGENRAIDDRTAQRHFPIWSGYPYYQKPTGLLCDGATLYLAVEDLNAIDYGDVPAATIARSDDGGRTWSVDREKPMFSAGVMTTVFFLDYGEGGAHGPADVAYAYALDGNWMWSAKVAPTKLYLAKVPKKSVQDLSTWEFFAGRADDGSPTWTKDLAKRAPVLEDETRRRGTPDFQGYSVLSQGSVTYLPALDRYLLSTGTEFTLELYESPAPWGPFTRLVSQDFGGPPFTADAEGGYAPTIPSKFVAADGLSFFVQSNTWAQGVDVNHFALRPVTLSRR